MASFKLPHTNVLKIILQYSDILNTKTVHTNSCCGTLPLPRYDLDTILKIKVITVYTVVFHYPSNIPSCINYLHIIVSEILNKFILKIKVIIARPKMETRYHYVTNLHI